MYVIPTTWKWEVTPTIEHALVSTENIGDSILWRDCREEIDVNVNVVRSNYTITTIATIGNSSYLEIKIDNKLYVTICTRDCVDLDLLKKVNLSGDYIVGLPLRIVEKVTDCDHYDTVLSTFNLLSTKTYRLGGYSIYKEDNCLVVERGTISDLVFEASSVLCWIDSNGNVVDDNEAVKLEQQFDEQFDEVEITYKNKNYVKCGDYYCSGDNYLYREENNKCLYRLFLFHIGLSVEKTNKLIDEVIDTTKDISSLLEKYGLVDKHQKIQQQNDAITFADGYYNSRFHDHYINSLTSKPTVVIYQIKNTIEDNNLVNNYL